jgi:hypothetical protein
MGHETMIILLKANRKNIDLKKNQRKKTIEKKHYCNECVLASLQDV